MAQSSSPPRVPYRDPRVVFLGRHEISRVEDRLRLTIIADIERAEVARGDAKLALDEIQEALKVIEDGLLLAAQAQGKNAEERKAHLSLLKAGSPEYQEVSANARAAEHNLVIRTAAFNRLMHEFAALRTVAEIYSSQNRVMAPGGGR